MDDPLTTWPHSLAGLEGNLLNHGHLDDMVGMLAHACMCLHSHVHASMATCGLVRA